MKTVCLIDDDEVYKLIFKQGLKLSGLDINLIEFNNGERAMDYFKSTAEIPDKLPGIIFLDINMPVGDGWEFLEEYARIRHTIDKTIRIYLISSSQNDKDYERARNISDISDYLIKPLTLDQLKSIFADKS